MSVSAAVSVACRSTHRNSESTSPCYKNICIRSVRDVSYFAIDVWRPNIQGELRNHNSDFTQPTGVFSIGSIQATGQGTDQGSTGSWVAYFYASRASSIYNGDKVQSPALQVLPCIRFWCTAELEVQLVELSILNKQLTIWTHRFLDRNLLSLIRHEQKKKYYFDHSNTTQLDRMHRQSSQLDLLKFQQCLVSIGCRAMLAMRPAELLYLRKLQMHSMHRKGVQTGHSLLC